MQARATLNPHVGIMGYEFYFFSGRQLCLLVVSLPLEP